MPVELTSKLPHLGTTIFTEMSALANRHGAVNVSQGFPDIPPPEGLVDAAVKALLAAGANPHAENM